jgi:hypothetical protein
MRVRDLAATVVAKQLPTSLAPIPKDMAKPKMQAATAIQYSSGAAASSGGVIRDMVRR